MTDEEFLAAFEDATLDPFHHRDHLRVTFLYLRHHGESGTRDRLGPAILHFATAKGAVGKYHETITLAWIALVSTAASGHETFDAMAAAHPHLLDKNLLNRFYSTALLQSPQARESWVEPDLQPISANR